MTLLEKMQIKYNKPEKLKEGDIVALITLSWGGAGECPERYLTGKKQIEDSLKLKVIETPNALKSSEWIYNHPEERLNDLLWAFENPKVKAIISIIGGDDSIRLLEYFKKEHLEIIKNNPKIFLGFSDTTTINFWCLKANLISFYGPSVLFGLAENGGIHDYTLEYLKKALFFTKPIGEIHNNNSGWTLDKVPWDSEHSSTKRKMQKPLNVRFIQGKKITEGKLIGGCMDVLEFMKGTPLWLNLKNWEDSILLLELSEEKPTPSQVKYWLRNYGAQGILKIINGIIFAIPGGNIDYDDPDYKSKLDKHISSFEEYDEVLLKVCEEYGIKDIPIVTNVQFGHIAPMITFPLGVNARIDPKNKKLTIIESGVK